jgi:phosphatidylinositol-bisphosphatase
VHLHLRLPPLRPRHAAPLKRLAAAGGSLFAGPLAEGPGLLQWGAAFAAAAAEEEDEQGDDEDAGGTTTTTSADPPAPIGAQPARGEDWDSAPAGELHFPGGFGAAPSSSSGGGGINAPFPSSSASFADSQLSAGAPPPPNPEAVSAMLADEASGRLWSATADGRVACWQVAAAAEGGSGASAAAPPPPPPRAARFLHSFQAHRGSKVKSMALTPWGCLVTGARNGSVKMWCYNTQGGSTAAAAPPVRWRTLRKPGVGGGGGAADGGGGGGGGGALAGTLGAPSAGADAHSRVVRVAMSAGGRVLWTAGRETLALWSAHSGQHLGTLRAPAWPSCGGGPAGIGGIGGGPGTSPRPSLAPPAGFEDPYGVNPRTGLPPQLIAGAFLGASVPGPAGGGEEGGGGGFDGGATLGSTVGGGGDYGGYGGYDDDEDPAAAALKAAGKAAAKAGRFLGKLRKKLADGAAAAAEKAATAATAAAAGGGGGGDGYYNQGDGYSTSPYAQKQRAGVTSSSDRGEFGGGGGRGGQGGQDGAAGGCYGGIKDLAALEDGSMLVAYRGGALERFSEAGQLLWSSLKTEARRQQQQQHQPSLSLPSLLRSGVTALAARPGGGAWVGCRDGHVVALDVAPGSAGACDLVVAHAWRAHLFPIRAFAAAVGGCGGGGGSSSSGSNNTTRSSILYTLARDGSVKGWPACPRVLAACSPHSSGPLLTTRPPSSPPWLATAAAAERRAWRRALQRCLRRRSVRVLVGTWNVAEAKPSRDSLRRWLGGRSAGASIVAIALQEVEMGTGSVAAAALFASGVVGRSRLEGGTAAGQAWAAELHACLDGGAQAWERVGMRQMSGVLAAVFARRELVGGGGGFGGGGSGGGSGGHVGDVATDAVPCGVLGVGGNKGATAVSLSLFRRRVVVVSSHFAAHQDAVEARNGDWAKIVRRLRFHNSSSSEAAAGGDDVDDGNNGADWGSGMRDAELLVWAGDFNYRVDARDGCLEGGAATGGGGGVPRPLTPAQLKALAAVDPQAASAEKAQQAAMLYDYVLKCVAMGPVVAAERLLPGDQLTREKAAGRCFRGMAEARVCFLPTYKHERGRDLSHSQQAVYDMGEKKRVPAWTDRVLFRGSVPWPQAAAGVGATAAASAAASLAPTADAVVAVPEDATSPGLPPAYGCEMSVHDSDHKPVYLGLSVTLPAYDQRRRRGAARRALGRLAALSAAAEDGGGGGDLRPLPSRGAASQQAQLLLDPPSVALRDGEAARVRLRLSGVGGSIGGGGGGAGCSWRLADALPLWLEASPAAGYLPAGEVAEITLRAAFGGGRQAAAYAGSVAGGYGGGGGVAAVALRVEAAASGVVGVAGPVLVVEPELHGMGGYSVGGGVGSGSTSFY